MVETLTPYGIIDDILEERERQDEKWGPPSIPDLRNRHPFHWLGILMEEVGEVAEEIVENPSMPVWSPEMRREVVQVAAVAVSWLEAMDRAKERSDEVVERALAEMGAAEPSAKMGDEVPAKFEAIEGAPGYYRRWEEQESEHLMAIYTLWKGHPETGLSVRVAGTCLYSLEAVRERALAEMGESDG